MPATIRLPWPPSVGRYWIQRVIAPKDGRKPFVHMTVGEKGLVFRANVLLEVLEKWPSIKPTKARLRVSIACTMPDRRARDLDNLTKATLDALTHAGVWGDDSQIDELHVTRGRVCSPGWLDVTIERIPQPEVQKPLFAEAQ